MRYYSKRIVVTVIVLSVIFLNMDGIKVEGEIPLSNEIESKTLVKEIDVGGNVENDKKSVESDKVENDSENKGDTAITDDEELLVENKEKGQIVEINDIEGQDNVNDVKDLNDGNIENDRNELISENILQEQIPSIENDNLNEPKKILNDTTIQSSTICSQLSTTATVSTESAFRSAVANSTISCVILTRSITISVGLLQSNYQTIARDLVILGSTPEVVININMNSQAKIYEFLKGNGLNKVIFENIRLELSGLTENLLIELLLGTSRVTLATNFQAVNLNQVNVYSTKTLLTSQNNNGEGLFNAETINVNNSEINYFSNSGNLFVARNKLLLNNSTIKVEGSGNLYSGKSLESQNTVITGLNSIIGTTFITSDELLLLTGSSLTFSSNNHSILKSLSGGHSNLTISNSTVRISNTHNNNSVGKIGFLVNNLSIEGSSSTGTSIMMQSTNSAGPILGFASVTGNIQIDGKVSLGATLANVANFQSTGDYPFFYMIGTKGNVSIGNVIENSRIDYDGYLSLFTALRSTDITMNKSSSLYAKITGNVTYSFLDVKGGSTVLNLDLKDKSVLDIDAVHRTASIINLKDGSASGESKININLDNSTLNINNRRLPYSFGTVLPSNPNLQIQSTDIPVEVSSLVGVNNSTFNYSTSDNRFPQLSMSQFKTTNSNVTFQAAVPYADVEDYNANTQRYILFDQSQVLNFQFLLDQSVTNYRGGRFHFSTVEPGKNGLGPFSLIGRNQNSKAIIQGHSGLSGGDNQTTERLLSSQACLLNKTCMGELTYEFLSNEYKTTFKNGTSTANLISVPGFSWRKSYLSIGDFVTDINSELEYSATTDQYYLSANVPKSTHIKVTNKEETIMYFEHTTTADGAFKIPFEQYKNIVPGVVELKIHMRSGLVRHGLGTNLNITKIIELKASKKVLDLQINGSLHFGSIPIGYYSEPIERLETFNITVLDTDPYSKGWTLSLCSVSGLQNADNSAIHLKNALLYKDPLTSSKTPIIDGSCTGQSIVIATSQTYTSKDGHKVIWNKSSGIQLQIQDYSQILINSEYTSKIRLILKKH